MSRKNGCNASKGVEGWPVEWTCAGFVVLFLTLIVQVGHLMPYIYVSKCTAIAGMCTPSDCVCPEPLQKRELVTHDAQACFQCIAQFCPSVADGDPDCSFAECECQDPAWPRIETKVAEKSCWQCVQPPLDFTARIGSDGDDIDCLALREVDDPLLPFHRLISSRNSSSCVAFRYNGNQIVEKRNGKACLVWQTFGDFWTMDGCDKYKESEFRRLRIEEADAAGSVLQMQKEVLCSGLDSSEFCIEVSETLCTEEEGRCSAEHCRCEDPTWSRHELQTFNGSKCYTCVPPSSFCTTSPSECTAHSCECADPSQTKVLTASSTSTSPCFRCKTLPRSSSRTSEVSTIFMFLFCVVLGIAGGGFIRRLRDPSATTSSRAKARRQAVSNSAWSERLAEKLEDLLEVLREIFIDNPMDLLRSLRPFLRQAGKWSGKLIDELELALEPLYVYLDWIQDTSWDWVGIQHERLVFLVFWLIARCGDASEILSSTLACLTTQNSFDEDDLPSSRGAKHRGSRRNSGTRKAPSRQSTPTQLATAKTALELDASPNSSTCSVTGIRPSSQAEKLQQTVPAVLVEETDGSRHEAAISCREEEPEIYDWDPLGITSNTVSQAEVAHSEQVVVPEQLLRTFMGASNTAAMAASRQTAVQGASSTAQSRVQRKLEQRRQAAARREAAPTQTIVLAEDPVDDSWIDELETEDQKGKSSSKKDAKAPKTSKKKPERAEKINKDVNLDEARQISGATDDAPADKANLSAEEEGKMDFFDPERLLGEAIHGLFLLAEANEVVSGTSKKVIKAKDAKQQTQSQDMKRKESPKEKCEAAPQIVPELAGKGAIVKTEAGNLQRAKAEVTRIHEVAQVHESRKKEDGYDEARRGRTGNIDKQPVATRPTNEAAVATSMQTQQRIEADPHTQKPQQERHRLIERQTTPQQEKQPTKPKQQQSPQTTKQTNQQQHKTQETQPPQPQLLRHTEQPSQQQQQQVLQLSSAKAAAPTPMQPSRKLLNQPPNGSSPSASNVGQFTGVTSLEKNSAANQKVPFLRGQPPEITPKEEQHQDGQPRPKKAWSQVVAAWAKTAPSGNDDEAPATKTSNAVSSSTSAKQTNYRPFEEGEIFDPLGIWNQPEYFQGQYHSFGDVHQSDFSRRGMSSSGYISDYGNEEIAMSSQMVRSIVVSGVPTDSTAEGFMAQLDSWGLDGSYDFFVMPMDKHTGQSAGYAFINFIDTAFVFLFCWIYQEYQFQGAITPAEVQGFEANKLQWQLQQNDLQDYTAVPVLLPDAVPSQWAVNAVNTMLSPQLRDQFRKTKLCVFTKKGRCEMGPSCPFAHSKEEQQPMPDLAKTKLCYNYFRGKCADSRCKFAHGSSELRAFWVPYSPGIWLTDDSMQGFVAYGTEDAQGFVDGNMGLIGDMPYLFQDLSTCLPINTETMDEVSLNCGLGNFSENRSLTEQILKGLHGPPDLSFYEATTLPKVATRSRSQSTHWPADASSGMALRVRGTFMEALQVEEEEGVIPSARRSWSEGDLAVFREAMDSEGLDF